MTSSGGNKCFHTAGYEGGKAKRIYATKVEMKGVLRKVKDCLSVHHQKPSRISVMDPCRVASHPLASLLP